MTLFGQEHVERYQATGGAEGHEWAEGTTVLLLETTGRRSGKHYTTPLIYREHDGAYMVVASKGGADVAPDWYSNLQANPDVTVQVGAERFPARARTATADERPQLWREMAEVWPAYNDYQSQTDRQIPVVVLERS
jgi:deazaflavin-dependent oxidoreductase (nitroreductase family)